MSTCIDYMKQLANAFRNSDAGRGYEIRLEEAREIKVESIVEYFGAEKAAEIRDYINPKKNECYRNALQMALYLGGTYCEGMVDVCIPIEHAFVCVDGHYFDPTFEFVLEDKDFVREYVLLHTWDCADAWQKTQQWGYYGDLLGDYIIARIKQERDLKK